MILSTTPWEYPAADLFDITTDTNCIDFTGTAAAAARRGNAKIPNTLISPGSTGIAAAARRIDEKKNRIHRFHWGAPEQQQEPGEAMKKDKIHGFHLGAPEQQQQPGEAMKKIQNT